MDESPNSEEKKGRPLHKIFTIILIAIILIAAIFYINFNILSGGNQENLVITTDYRAILPKDAFDLINKSQGDLPNEEEEFVLEEKGNFRKKTVGLWNCMFRLFFIGVFLFLVWHLTDMYLITYNI